MRTEHDLRSALRALEQETPAAEQVLRHVGGRTSDWKAGRRPGRRLMAGAAAAAAVIAIVVAAALLSGPPAGHGRGAAQDALQSLPRYYMTLVPTNPRAFAESGPTAEATDAVVKDTITGQVLAIVRPPKPYITFTGITGAADDRTFVLTASSTIYPSLTRRPKFFYARFNPADDAVTLTPLALSGLAASSFVATAVLSPDGTKLAVASDAPEQITVYSLPSGAARTWTAYINSPTAYPRGIEVLSWSRTGILAFGWNGGYTDYAIVHGRPKPEGRYSPPGEYLLNTNTAGGSLWADSRDALCFTQAAADADFAFESDNYLTPDGTKIIIPLARPIPVGQTLPPCTGTPHPGGAQPTPGGRPPKPQFEEFSATTGRAVSLIDASQSHEPYGGSGVYWSDPSGGVLVVFGRPKSGAKTPWGFGILSGSVYTPIPGSSSPPIVAIPPQIAF
jgi:hypothetical protein